jgi:hypothetical protein
MLDQFDYSSILFGKLQKDSFKEVLTELEKSSNEAAKNKVQQVLYITSRRVSAAKEGIKNNDKTYSIITNNKKLREVFEKSTGKFDSIE